MLDSQSGKNLSVRLNKKLFLIAALVYLILGILHVLGHFVVIYRLKGSLAYRAMQLAEVDLFFIKRSVYRFLNGFSLTMGVLMIAYGVLNLLLLSQFSTVVYNRPVLLFNGILALCIAVISLVFFVTAPIILFLLVSVFFGVMLLFSVSESKVD